MKRTLNSTWNRLGLVIVALSIGGLTASCNVASTSEAVHSPLSATASPAKPQSPLATPTSQQTAQPTLTPTCYAPWPTPPALVCPWLPTPTPTPTSSIPSPTPFVPPSPPAQTPTPLPLPEAADSPMGELFFAAFFAPEAPPSEPELLHVPVDELGRLTSSPAPFTWTPLGDARMTVGRLSVSPSGTYLTSAYDTEIGESVIVVDLLTAQQTAYVYGGRLFNWHPNDHEFLFAAQEAETDPGLWLVEVSTGEYRLLAQPAALSYANLSGAAISPDGQVLAFSITGPGIAQIWLSNADGSEPRMALDSNATAIVHSWSPDGRYLLYSGEPRPEAGKMTPLPPEQPLWVMSREGQDRRPLNMQGESLGTISDPVWSPTGQYIAAVGETSDALHCHEAGMTPSADRLCPFRSRSVYVEDVETGEVWLAAQDAIDPTWSPDGSMLAVAKMDESDQADLWLVDITDRSLHRITDTPEINRYPVWLEPR